MKKISLFVLFVLLFSLFSCTKNVPEGPLQQPQNEPVLPESEIAGYEVFHTMVEGFFPNDVEELKEHSDNILIVTPTELFMESDNAEYYTLRKCRVQKVLKGDNITDITLSEPMYIQDFKVFVTAYNDTPMFKDYQYLVFSHKSKDKRFNFIFEAFCLNTEMGEKYPVNFSKGEYHKLLLEYDEYFDDYDFRVSNDLERVFSTKDVDLSMGEAHFYEVDGVLYRGYSDFYNDYSYYFYTPPKFVYSGKTTKHKLIDERKSYPDLYFKDTGDNFRVYNVDNSKYADKIIFVLKDGELCPAFKYYDTSSPDFLKTADITEIRIYEQFYENYCYNIPKEKVSQIISQLTDNTFEQDKSDNMIDDKCYLLEFRDSVGINYHVYLYYDKSQMFRLKIGEKVRDAMLCHITEQNKVPNGHMQRAYRQKP